MLLLIPFIILLILFIILVMLFSGLLISFIGLLASFIGVVLFSIFNFFFINVPCILSLSVGFIILSCSCCISLLCTAFWGTSILVSGAGLFSFKQLLRLYRQYNARIMGILGMFWNWITHLFIP